MRVVGGCLLKVEIRARRGGCDQIIRNGGRYRRDEVDFVEKCGRDFAICLE